MTTQNTKRPMFEIGFCPLNERDGKPGSMIKLAAVWPKEGKAGGIVRYFSPKANPFTKIGKGAVFLEPYRLPENPDTTKSYPLYELFYCTSKQDQYDKEYLDAGLRIATVWPAKEGKKLPRINFHLNPASPEADFGPGQAFLLDITERQAKADSAEPAHDPETGEVYDTPASDYGQAGPAPQEQF